MKFLRVEIKNFLAIGNLAAALDSRGLVLIQGVNEDDSSQDSNGSGKSSFPDAISWCCFGETARGDSGDSVINNKAKKDCSVTVHLVDGEDTYQISRYRKHKTEKNRLRVYGNELELTLGTDRLTQEVVNKILGCNHQIFCAAVYAGQEKMPSLPDLTDKFLKTLVEEAAGIDKLQAAHELARKDLSELTKEEVALTSSLSAQRDMLKAQMENLQDLQNSKDEEAERKVEKAKAYKVAIKDARDRIVHLKRHYEDAQSANYKAEAGKKGLEDALKGVEGENAELERLRAVLTKFQRAAAIASSNEERAVTVYKEAIRKAKEVQSAVGEPCEECGKPYEEHDIEGAKIIAIEKARQAKESWEVAGEEAKEAEASAARASFDLTEYEKTVTDPKATLDALRAFDATTEAYKKSVAALKTEVGHVRALEHQLLELEGEKNSFIYPIDQLEEKIGAKVTEIDEVKVKLLRAQALVIIKQRVVDVFSPSGVRAHILDTVTPYLNQRTEYYLSNLTDNNITAVWSTLSKTASGELRERFAIDVDSKTGASSFKGLSGGEKRKVRLATFMALQDLVASRATKPLELFIADEIDHALDESGLERLMTLLREKAMSTGTVLVISHNSLSDWISNVVTIKKSSGVSSMEGVAL